MGIPWRIPWRAFAHVCVSLIRAFARDASAFREIQHIDGMCPGLKCLFMTKLYRRDNFVVRRHKIGIELIC